MRNKPLKLVGLLSVVALLTMPQVASAATPAGTVINNQATLTYSVGGVTQPTVSNTPGGTESFVVDHAVDLTVATSDTAAVSVAPGQTGNVLTFTVTNTGNKVQDVILSATTVATGGTAKFGGTDNADMTAPVSIFVDSNGNGAYDAGTDTATFIDELAAGASVTVFIVADAPSTLVDGDIASYHLLAQAAQGGAAGTQGAAETQTPAASRSLGAEDVIFADAAGTDTANDAANDGKHSDQDDYKVASAQISISKSVTVVSDPIGGTDPIPGATVKYTITITNAAGATASAILSTVSDALDANLTAVQTAGAASWSVTGSTRATTTGTLTLDNADANGDGLGLNAGSVDYNLQTILAADAVNGYAAGELKPGESLALTFQATIN